MLADGVWCALRGITQHSPEHPGVHDVARHSNGHEQDEKEHIEQEECARDVLHSLELHPGLTAGTFFSKWRHPCRECRDGSMRKVDQRTGNRGRTEKSGL